MARSRRPSRGHRSGTCTDRGWLSLDWDYPGIGPLRRRGVHRLRPPELSSDERGNLWFEEYIVSPPTHILNGFIWAAWGVYDYFLATESNTARDLFAQAVRTLRANLNRYDLGFWSLYEQSGTLLPMVASPFYHRLHVVQLRVMHRLTGDETFARRADKWEAYARSRAKRTRALCYKSAFKLGYY